MKRIFHHLKNSVESFWYPPLLAFLAALDYFVVVIPTDGLLISSSMAAPKRWVRFFLWLSAGSTLGAAAFAAVLHVYGNPFLDWLLPTIHQNKLWILSDHWMDTYGLGAIFGISALPLFIHPIIAIAALTGTPVPQIALMVFLGRLVKYGVFSWLASHAPDLLFRLKGVRKEVTQAKEDYLDN